MLQVALSGLLMGLIYALVAAGLSLIFGLMDVVNFAHGELLMLAMYATFFLNLYLGLDPLVLLPIVAAIMFALGVAIYRGLISRALGVRFNRGMVQIFVTFGLAIFIRGAAQLAFGGDFRSVGASPGWPTGRPICTGSTFLCRNWRQVRSAWSRSPGCSRSAGPSSAGRWRRRGRIGTRWR